MKINSRMSEAALASEEFTQRMATMEAKLQQVTAERDGLKEENKVVFAQQTVYPILSVLCLQKFVHLKGLNISNWLSCVQQ